MGHGAQASTQCDTTNQVHTNNCRPLEDQKKQVERSIAVKESDVNANLNWRDELEVPKYVGYCNKFLEMTAQF